MGISLENLKNSLQAVKHKLNRKAEALDWQENDPNSLSYIKNRMGGYTEHIYEKVGGTFTWSSDMNLVQINGFECRVGQEYTITINGHSFRSVLKSSEEVSSTVASAGGFNDSATITLEDGSSKSCTRKLLILKNGGQTYAWIYALQDFETGESYLISDGETLNELTIEFNADVPVKIPIQYIPKHENIARIPIQDENGNYIWSDAAEQIVYEFESGKVVFLLDRYNDYTGKVLFASGGSGNLDCIFCRENESAIYFASENTSQNCSYSLSFDNLNLPSPRSANSNGKFLGVSESGRWELKKPPVPAYSAAENGKVLGVVDGQLAWVDK